MSDQAPCMWMRGGTSKGGFFLKSDLPADEAERDAFLLSIMGSPDLRQIDGMGGADPLTSKIAVVSKSDRDDADINYMFLQVKVEDAVVTDAQNCGNILAGVGPFALERNLIDAQDGQTPISIYMENTDKIVNVLIETPDGKVTYKGDASIDGVPGTSSPISIEFKDIAGSTCGALLPTGNNFDVIDGIKVTLIDNGMPCVILDADNMGITGSETREELEANTELRERLEKLRLIAGPMMNLGDVRDKTMPKMTMVSAPLNGGAINTRSFIPHRCHASIGVLAAVSVATACLLDGSPAARLAYVEAGNTKQLKIEHPIGETTIVANLDDKGDVASAAILRTARKLFDGLVFAS